MSHPGRHHAAMVLVPRPCLDCRHGVVIPAIVTAGKVSVLYCVQRQPDIPDRTTCPRYDRDPGIDERSSQSSRSVVAVRPAPSTLPRSRHERGTANPSDLPDARGRLPG